VLKEANAAFNMAIRALDSVKRDEADAVAAIRALVAVTKAVLVNANCVSQGAAASVASNALACLCKV
jgi:hypothetical protein